MKQHCQQQCNNAEKIVSLQDDQSVITCIAIQETDEHWLNWFVLNFYVVSVCKVISLS